MSICFLVQVINFKTVKMVQVIEEKTTEMVQIINSKTIKMVQEGAEFTWKGMNYYLWRKKWIST